MEEVVLLIQEIGFPIVVSFYLLYRIETKLEAIHTAIIGMRE
ncbi:YvrJ family protein [Ureibacillus acetophenoni]|uniref:YvrJ-like protein n=1 Tax=Ureibacillus acetophenoni TaxID=614649 RepID=A0A285U5J5_9BACL|nr:YvrJ family protein [Ureibacillus acetophenoni]SOC37195.1 YvrJ-like protein [Ureibacillus acetophenoni]